MKVEQIEEIIEPDYEYLVRELKDNIISIFVIGSMQKSKMELKKNNDYDLRIVVKIMDEYTYRVIVNFNETIKKKIISRLNIDVNYSLIIGPARYITKSKITLLIHCIPLTIETLDNLPLTHKYSYSNNYRLIFGKDILKQYKTIRYSGKDIIECIEGINYCIDMINNNTLKYTEWKIDNKSIKLMNETQKMNENIMFEVLRYSLSKSIYNAIQINKWKGKKTYNNEKEYLESLNINDRIINDVENLISCNFESFKGNKERFKKETLEILETIKQHIK